MNLTLDDFRNILGKVNDGDVVFTKDNNGNATGIEKANYGRLRKHNVKGVSADDSVKIRELFVAAIRSASGQHSPQISEETLQAIRIRLGIGEGQGRRQTYSTRTSAAARSRRFSTSWTAPANR